MAFELTPGGVAHVLTDGASGDVTLQVIDMKTIGSVGAGPVRHRSVAREPRACTPHR